MAETGLRTAKLHQLTILLGIGLPSRESWLAVVGELSPDRTQEFTPQFIGFKGFL